MVKTPNFWYEPRWFTPLLAPLGQLYHWATQVRFLKTSPYKCPIPVICVGNLVMGGAGKTPTVIALVEILRKKGFSPHILSRGYKGNIQKNTLVEPRIHSFQQVGDEPLLLAQHAPVWVGKNRVLSAEMAYRAGADLLIMDDGLQNPTLYQDLKLVVMDGLQGFGNGYVFPAGPLRENMVSGLRRIDGVIMINGKVNLPVPKPTFLAHTNVTNRLTHQKVVGFAGLGFPEKFRKTLVQEGYEVCNFHEFPDHYVYQEADLQKLGDGAAAIGAHLVTTAKDMLRIPEKWHGQISVLDIELCIDEVLPFSEFLVQKFL